MQCLQEVTDAEGRRRFHGAFTGGYSAGYYNTVGSLEGWTPSTFKSSRQDRGAARLFAFLYAEMLKQVAQAASKPFMPCFFKLFRPNYLAAQAAIACHLWREDRTSTFQMCGQEEGVSKYWPMHRSQKVEDFLDEDELEEVRKSGPQVRAEYDTFGSTAAEQARRAVNIEASTRDKGHLTFVPDAIITPVADSMGEPSAPPLQRLAPAAP